MRETSVKQRFKTSHVKTFNAFKVLGLSPIVFYLLFVFFIPRLSLGNYVMTVINLALIYSLSAYGISIMLGMGGQLIFSNIAFMGAGAFFVANMCAPKQGVNMDTWTSLLLLIPAAALVSFAIGLILLRLHGTYFTFSTIALTQVCFAIYNNYKPLFGGADGIAGIPILTLFGYSFSSYTSWFYLLCGIVLIAAMLVERIRRTQLGRALASVRDNATAAVTLGINVYMTKVIGFTIAGTLASLAGALYCFHGKYAAADMFTYNNSVQHVIMAMLGGVNSTAGVFVGSLLVSVLPELLKGLERYFQLFWGVSIILLMVFMPTGLAGLLGKAIKSFLNKNSVP